MLVKNKQMSIAKENPSGPSFARSQSGPSGQHGLTWERYHRLAGKIKKLFDWKSNIKIKLKLNDSLFYRMIQTSIKKNRY